MPKEHIPQRKNLRLKDFDYSSNNYYFVTICTKGNKPLLSSIVGDGAHTVPRKITLKPYGKIVEKHILRINSVYENIRVEKYIIMPNHIHMLIFIDRFHQDNETVCNKVNDKNGTMWASSPTTDLSTVVRTFKTMVTKEIGISIWQRSFYDEIIKSETHFQNVWNYTVFNALKEYSNKKEK